MIQFDGQELFSHGVCDQCGCSLDFANKKSMVQHKRVDHGIGKHQIPGFSICVQIVESIFLQNKQCKIGKFSIKMKRTMVHGMWEAILKKRKF